jgi:hypothetical protein
MKYLFVVLSIIGSFLPGKIFAQQKADSLIVISKKDIVGVWQEGSPSVGAGYGTYFQFYKDGRFIYNTSGYDQTHILYNIYGKYRLEGNALLLKVKYRKELRDADVAQTESAMESGLFKFEGGKAVTIQQKDTTEMYFNLTKDAKKYNKICIKIENDKYYKVESNPDK